MSEDPTELPLPQKITITTRPFAGFAIESAKNGEPVRVQHMGGLTASDPYFYLYINQLSDDFLSKANIFGGGTSKFFVVQRPDGTADVYTEYAVVVEAKVDGPIQKGDPVYLHDIGDITSYRPAGISLRPTDTVICVMKAGWKYGLFFDASRNITEEAIWRQLGELYRTLHVDREIARIQKQVREHQAPHVITEGKTDWRHIESARRALGVDMLLKYPTTDEPLGSAALLELCKRLPKFGPPNANKVIAVFDRDEQQILRALGARGDLDRFQAWGNNVYSLVLPLPSHRHDYKNVSIEMLYTDAGLATTTSDGKRLYFDNELKIEVVPGSEPRHIPISAVAARELTKKPFDERAASIVDDSGRQVGLSKASFAKLVYDGTDGFGALDVTAFEPVFKIIKDIMADSTGTEPHNTN